MRTEPETYTLKQPVEIPAVTIKSKVEGQPDIVVEPAKVFAMLKFRPPRGGDMPAIEDAARTGNIARINLVMIAQLADVTSAVAERLLLEDYEKAAEIAGDFFPKPVLSEKPGG